MNEHSIFRAVQAIDDPAERSVYLDVACASDRDLRSRVEQLLQAHQGPGRLTDSPPVVPAPPRKVGETQAETPAGDTDIQELSCLIPSNKPGVLGRLGRYDVLEIIGKGGMGTVLRAFDKQLQRMVAIKVMAAHLATNATARKRFSREARAVAAVTHDHIVTIHAVEEASGLPYLVMKYVAGLTLKQRLDRDGPLPLREVLRIGMEMASGLAAAHAKGLIHRDIKPANLLLESEPEASATEGRVKITDFGLARAADDASLTQTGLVAGTPDYMSPEQARGEAMDHRTDLFSLGSVLYAMCTGRPPFHGRDTMAILNRVCEEAPTPIREFNCEIPDGLVAIIEKLHAKDPARRFQSAAEVAELLSLHLARLQNPLVAPLPSHSPNTAREVPAAGPRLTRKRHWVVPAVILVLCLGGFALTEVLGVTKLTGTALRVFRPANTPFVEGNDPGVQGADEHVLKNRPETESSTTAIPINAESGWVQLFNGKDLAGWKTQPEKSASWKVENGELVGTGNPRSLLTTERADYQNFHFRVEVKINQGGESGQYFRGQREGNTGYEAQISLKNTNPNTGTLSRFHGRLWSTLQRVDRQVVSADTWFVQEVIADGSYLVVKINGQTVATVVDSTHTRGYLALEAGGGDTVVHFRTIEIKELPPEVSGWVSLFNGKDLTGWKTHPSARGNWRVEDGVLVGDGPQRSHLFSERGDYENFHLRAEAQINQGGNSGIYARAKFEGGFPGGYEAQINNSTPDLKTGSLYYRLTSGAKLGSVPFNQVLAPPEEWFKLEIITEGNRITILVNGKKTVEFIDPDRTYRQGHVALQQHDDKTVVQFRKIELKEPH